MRYQFPRHIAVTVTATLVTCMLAACGAQTESQLLASAKSHIEKSDSESAVLEIRSALQKNPDSAEARFLLGKTLLERGEPVAASVELQKARALKYIDSAVVPLLAKSMLVVGQAKNVTEMFGSTTLADTAAQAELQSVLAAAFATLGNQDRSRAAIDAALRLDPKNVSARVQRARLLGFEGNIDAALELVRQTVTDSPKVPEAWHLNGELLLGGKKDVPGARKAFENALTAQPRFLPARAALIELALRSNDAAEFKSQVIALKAALPKHPVTQFYQAQLSLMDGDVKGARQVVLQLLRTAPDNPRLLELAGKIELRSGSLVQAETYLAKSVAAAPSLPEGRKLLARTYIQAGQAVKAIEQLQPLVDRAQPDSDALALMAEAKLQLGDVAAAESLYAQAAKIDPSNTTAQAALAIDQIMRGDAKAGFAQLQSIADRDQGATADMAIYSARLRRGELDDALKALDRVQAKQRDKPQPEYLRARILAMRNDEAGARKSLENALAVDPGYFPAIDMLAAYDFAQKKPEAARKRYEELLQRDPSNYLAVVALAEIRRRGGAAPIEVTKLLEDAVKASPAAASPRLTLIEYLLAQNSAKAALAAARDADIAIPNNMQVLDALGRAQFAAGDAQTAIGTFSRVAAAQPKNVAAQLRLANAHFQSRDLPSAAKVLRQSLRTTPEALPLQQRLIEVELALKRPDAAIEVAREVQRQRPSEPVGHVLESSIWAERKDWHQATAAARAGLDRFPTPSMASNLHGLYLRSKRDADAAKFVSDWERGHPADTAFQAYLGKVAIDRKDFAAAEARFRKVLAQQPKDVVALNNTAWLMVQQGKSGAVEFATKALDQRPDSTALMDTLATALAADQQLPKAIEWQRKAVAAAPEDGFYRLNLAKLLVKAGDKAGAKTELDTLAKLGSAFPAKAEVAKLLGELKS